MSLFNRSILLGKVALAITAGVVLHGQEVTGNLAGTVKDDKGAAVQGAKIIIRAPQLILPKVVVSEANGTFRAPLLPPGDYQLVVEKAGYMAGKAVSMRISVGSNMHYDFIVRPVQSAAATVEVVASAATVDKSETKSATSLSNEFMLAIPTSGGDRSFTGAMDFSPGVVTNAGGGTSIRGGLTQETGYTLNGASIKDDYEGRQNTQRLIDDAVEDTQVIQSNLHARFGRTGGGTVNVVTKSGGNDFAGSIRTYTSRLDWTAKGHNEQIANPDGHYDDYSNHRFDIFVSGPIIKDRLWFAISTIQRPNESSSNVVMNGEDPSQWSSASQSGNQYGIDKPASGMKTGSLYTYDLNKSVATVYTQNYIDSKFTLAISSDHTVDFAFQQNQQSYANENPYGIPIIATLGSSSYPYTETDKLYSYGYRGTFGSDLFVEARYSKATAHVIFPAPPLQHVRLTYGGTGSGVLFPYGFNISPSPDKRDNQSGNLNIKKFIEAGGTHEVDLGYDFYEFQRGTQSANGPTNSRVYVAAASADTYATGMSPDPYGNKVAFQAVNITDAGGVGSAEFPASNTTVSNVPVLRRYFGKDGTSKTRTVSFYINDAWAVNSHLNFMFGLRSDKFRVEDTDGTVLVNKQGPIAPRFQARFDPDGGNKDLFTFTAAKYVEEIGAGFASNFIKAANSAYADYAWTAPTAWVDYNHIVNFANYGNNLTNALYFSNASVNNKLNDLSNPYVLEFTLGYKHSYTNGSTFGLTLVHKDWKNAFSVSQENDLTHLVSVPDPSGSGLAPKSALQTWYGNSDLLKRTYNAAELDFRHIISSIWVFGGNYTWSRLVGNGNGGDNASQGFFDATFTSPVNQRNTLLATGLAESAFAPSGLLLSNQTQKARLYLTATLPMGKGHISYSAMLRYDSGATFGASELAKLPAGTGSLAGIAASSYTYWGTQRGVFSYPDTYQVDAKIDWALPLGWGNVQLMGYVQINNLFNNMEQKYYSNGFKTGVLASPVTAPINVANAASFGTDANNFNNWIAGRSLIASIGVKF